MIQTFSSYMIFLFLGTKRQEVGLKRASPQMPQPEAMVTYG